MKAHVEDVVEPQKVLNPSHPDLGVNIKTPAKAVKTPVGPSVQVALLWDGSRNKRSLTPFDKEEEKQKIGNESGKKGEIRSFLLKKGQIGFKKGYLKKRGIGFVVLRM